MEIEDGYGEVSAEEAKALVDVANNCMKAGFFDFENQEQMAALYKMIDYLVNCKSDKEVDTCILADNGDAMMILSAVPPERIIETLERAIAQIKENFKAPANDTLQ